MSYAGKRSLSTSSHTSRPPKTRRGLRSTRAGIRRKLLHTIKQASLDGVVETVVSHDILLVRPRAGVDIRYGYPVSKSTHGLHQADYDPPSVVDSPSAHAS